MSYCLTPDDFVFTAACEIIIHGCTCISPSCCHYRLAADKTVRPAGAPALITFQFHCCRLSHVVLLFERFISKEERLIFSSIIMPCLQRQCCLLMNISK